MKRIKEKMPKGDWVTIHKDMSEKGIERSFLEKLEYFVAKHISAATLDDKYRALAITIRDRLIERWIATQNRYHRQNVKRVYYLSMEFLIGRLLGNNILNLGIWEETNKAMKELGIDIDELRECETDAGLGNGGLGRLAVCLLDSMTTLGIPAHGYGIRYDYGIFKQKIIDGFQVEFPDKWLSKENPWEFQRLEYTAKLKLYGRVQVTKDKDGKDKFEWVDAENILAVPYDIPLLGYKTEVVNTLRLWSAKSSEEFDFHYFNDGDYEGAVYNKVQSESISKVLYPNDKVYQGKELRLKQEYFFTAASISDIIRRFKIENSDLKTLPDKAVIQLNDTHPALAIAELMRILIDEEGLEWEVAWDLVVRTFAYTNHTVMPEALEKWAIPMFDKLLPRHMQIIYDINAYFLKQVSQKFPHDFDRLRRMSIIEEGDPKKIRMSFLAIAGSHSTNGVSELHTSILKSSVFKDFYELFPERFNNKTNGITQRRWLRKANTRLSDLIIDKIGENWITDFYELKKLTKLAKDESFCRAWQEVKRENKKFLSEYIYKNMGIEVNPNSIFDVQIKRMHEYKRQLMFGLFMIAQYLRAKNNPQTKFHPRTFIVAGKAAPGYFMAKLIIKFINSIAEIVNADRVTKDKIKIVFLEDYRVSLAEKIFPASELSEQISTAGTEASGTGCMKFMLNGALTVGTYDGANLEMAQEVGYDNIFLFGHKVEDLRRITSEGYKSSMFINGSPVLSEILDLIQGSFFSAKDRDRFWPIFDYLYKGDCYYVCADFDPYCDIQDKVVDVYNNKMLWTEKSIINVANAGKFSSDRTIREYAKDIWDIPVK